MSRTNGQIALRVSVNTIIGNALLSAIKLVAGIVGNSTAMVSDAVHSLSDVFSTVVVIIGTKLSAKESDEDHPYGHERLECVCAAILSVMLAMTGIGIGYAAIQNIVSGEYLNAKAPGMIALLAALISIIVKEWMYHYTRAAGKKIGSGALMADAWHHRSDALSSIGSLIGVVGARMGVMVLDSIAGIIICLLIIKVSYDILSNALGKMTDTACEEELISQIRSIVMSVEGVIQIDDLKTRRFGERVYIDIEICVDSELTVREGHVIAETVHDKVETTVPATKHCMVHVNPYEKIE